MYHEFVIRTKFHIHKSHVRVVISIENLTLVTYIVMCGQRLCKIYIYNIYIYIYIIIVIKHVNIIQMQRMYDEWWMYNK